MGHPLTSTYRNSGNSFANVHVEKLDTWRNLKLWGTSNYQPGNTFRQSNQIIHQPVQTCFLQSCGSCCVILVYVHLWRCVANLWSVFGPALGEVIRTMAHSVRKWEAEEFESLVKTWQDILMTQRVLQFCTCLSAAISMQKMIPTDANRSLNRHHVQTDNDRYHMSP